MTADVYARTASNEGAPPASVAAPAAVDSPLALLQAVLENPTGLAHVRRYATDDFMYVSLNHENPELNRIMPWAGTPAGTEGLVQTFKDVFRFRSVVAFETQDRFENGDGAAIVGCVTYRSNVPGMTATSLHAILTRARGEKLAFARFMEDSFAPARSFRESGTYRIRANPDDSSALDV